VISNRTPQVLNDIYQNYGQDIQVSITGDLLISNGSTRSQQRVLRRLLTSPLDYIWHTDYGAGVGNFVGQALSSDLFDEIRSLINSQIFLEDSVSQTPPPEIFLQTIQGGLWCQINYTENPTQQPIVLTFNV